MAFSCSAVSWGSAATGSSVGSAVDSALRSARRVGSGGRRSRGACSRYRSLRRRLRVAGRRRGLARGADGAHDEEDGDTGDDRVPAAVALAGWGGRGPRGGPAARGRRRGGEIVHGGSPAHQRTTLHAAGVHRNDRSRVPPGHPSDPAEPRVRDCTIRATTVQSTPRLIGDDGVIGKERTNRRTGLVRSRSSWFRRASPGLLQRPELRAEALVVAWEAEGDSRGPACGSRSAWVLSYNRCEAHQETTCPHLSYSSAISE